MTPENDAVQAESIEAFKVLWDTRKSIKRLQLALTHEKNIELHLGLENLGNVLPVIKQQSGILSLTSEIQDINSEHPYGEWDSHTQSRC